MSKTLSEDSEGKRASANEFGTRQLFRRPAPTAGGCPCDYEWAIVAGTTTVTVNNNTLKTITWTNHAIAPGATAFSINTATSPFRILLDGWYQILLNVEWTGAGFTDVRLYRVDASAGFDNIGSGTTAPRIEISSPYTAGAMFSIAPVHIRSFSHSNLLKAQVQQSSGVGKDLVTGYFTIVYLGPGLGIDDGVTTINDLYTAF